MYKKEIIIIVILENYFILPFYTFFSHRWKICISLERRCKCRLTILIFSSTIASPQKGIYKNKSRRAPAITRGRLRRVLICLREHSRPSRVCVYMCVCVCVRLSTNSRANLCARTMETALKRAPASPTPAVNLVDLRIVRFLAKDFWAWFLARASEFLQ